VGSASPDGVDFTVDTPSLAKTAGRILPRRCGPAPRCFWTRASSSASGAASSRRAAPEEQRGRESFTPLPTHVDRRTPASDVCHQAHPLLHLISSHCLSSVKRWHRTLSCVPVASGAGVDPGDTGRWPVSPRPQNPFPRSFHSFPIYYL